MCPAIQLRKANVERRPLVNGLPAVEPRSPRQGS